MKEPTNEGVNKMRRWRQAQRSLESANRAVTSAEVELANATNDLGKWMWPKDGQPEEKFCIWYGDSLIEVSKEATGEFHLRIRQQGTSLL